MIGIGGSGKMPEASDNGSQPYSYPTRGCEMAGEG